MSHCRPDVPFVPTVASFSAPEGHSPRENRALVCVRDDDWRRAAHLFLESRGFNIEESHGVSGMSSSAFGRFDLILVQTGDECDVILNAVNSWTGAWRRFLNLIVLGDASSSHDDQIAFRLGVNSYVHLSDLPRAEALLEASRQRYVEMVGPWMDIFRLR
jgi:hypothetical protein